LLYIHDHERITFTEWYSFFEICQVISYPPKLNPVVYKNKGRLKIPMEHNDIGYDLHNIECQQGRLNIKILHELPTGRTKDDESL
jgi:hypothetical protein